MKIANRGGTSGIIATAIYEFNRRSQRFGRQGNKASEEGWQKHSLLWALRSGTGLRTSGVDRTRLVAAARQRAIEIPRKARFFDGRLHKDFGGRNVIRRNAQYFLRNGEQRQRFTARFFSSRRYKEMDKYPRQSNKQESNK